MSFNLDELLQKQKLLIAQKDMAMQTFHQVVGAISIVEELIKKVKEDMSKNDETHNQDPE